MTNFVQKCEAILIRSFRFYCGKEKPSDIHSFRQDFISEFKDPEANGLLLNKQHVITAAISCFICDALARAFAKRLKVHTGYYGYEKYVEQGKWQN